MSRRVAPLLGALCLFLTLAAAPVHAENRAAAADGSLGSVLELLVDKGVLSAQEAASLSRRGVEAAQSASLVELLRAKGIISAEEASRLSAAPLSGAAAAQVMPPSEDANFIAKLRELWVKKKNRGKDFDEYFAGMSDPEEVMGRMRVMGVLSAEEAEELERLYRDRYMTGAISAALEHKEHEYLERVRKGVSWELDEKIKEKFKNEWSQRIALSGDFRLRYQQDLFDDANGDFLRPENPTQLMNSKSDRQMLRIRGRFGLDAKVDDAFAVGIGLATGSTSNPTSTNQTLGDSLNKKPITLDKAFLKWSPDASFNAWGGRFPSPWFSTDLVWDQDINFDGVALQYRPRLSDRWSMFVTTGVFPLQELELSQRDKWLLGGQLGVQYKRFDQLTLKLAAAYYGFEHTVGIVNDPARPGLTDFTAPQFQQKGNTLMDIDPTTGIKTAYAADYQELNLTGSLDLGYWDPVRVVFSADYVQNLGFEQEEVSGRAGGEVNEDTKGYQLGVTVGYPKPQELWDWSLMLAYKYLESDAVMDAFTDSDFHLGGTNAKGWIARVDLGVAKNTWLTSKWLSANEISGPPLAIDVFQLDLNAKF